MHTGIKFVGYNNYDSNRPKRKQTKNQNERD